MIGEKRAVYRLRHCVVWKKMNYLTGQYIDYIAVCDTKYQNKQINLQSKETGKQVGTICEMIDIPLNVELIANVV